MHAMQCHECGRPVTDDDRFCGGCGASLDGVTDATEPIPAIVTDMASTVGPLGDETPDDAEPHWNADPVWAPTGQIPVTEPANGEASRPASITDELPATEPVTEVLGIQVSELDPDLVPPADAAPPADTPPIDALPIDALPLGAPAIEPDPVGTSADETPTGPTAVTTDQIPPQGPTTTAQMPLVPTPIHEPLTFRPGAVSGLSLLGAIITMIATFATVVSVTSSQRIIPTADAPQAFRTGTWVADDLAGNLSIAALVAVATMLGGGVAAAFGWRGGSGLAGGAGLAVAGLVALTVGLAQVPIDAAYDMAAIPTDNQFTLTITRDIGYWLLIAAGVIGLVVFFASINDAFGDRRAGLNPWIAALGALGALVLAGGPLIPEQLGVFSDNWYVTDAPGTAPSILLTGRIIQLALIALAGLLGFLSVKRWGLGVAIGGALPAIWLVMSTTFELTDGPIGPGYLNPGATDLRVHGVTIIGASAVLAFGALALVAAYEQSRHDRAYAHPQTVPPDIEW
jgi:hypothetical protein